MLLSDEGERLVFPVAARSRPVIHSNSHQFVQLVQPTALQQPERLNVLEALEILQDGGYAQYHVVDTLGDRTEAETLPGGLIEIPERTFMNARKGVPRDRVTVVHEVGHAWMHMRELEHASKRQTGIALHRRGSLPAYLDPEWQAFEFALYALAPTAPLKMVLDNVALWWDRADAVADAFGLSVPAAESRLRSYEKFAGVPK